ncbi:uncharacterized protein Bfra_008467 [Botrytis fragariae]|uniref:Uncharacterized protein n=1 Tax=Botrytis fragariae TaxID=1964551 RepID=A0A8H6AT62_9HELO|nr:uncharacterized protein Bfra_008467 [Botrytis fragariae]KAF5873189.1 hypothetical protein Bfra_008467 [Botrytis fragariae]
MLSMKTLEIVRHQTSIWAVTTRIAVIGAVVSAPVALPSSTRYCSITRLKESNFCPDDFVGLTICLLGVFIGLIISMCACYEVSQKNFKDLISWLKYRPKEEWEEIIDSLANALEYPPYKVHHFKKRRDHCFPYKILKMCANVHVAVWGASNAIERDNDVKDYIRGVRGLSKSIKVDDDGKISQDTIDDLFLNVYPMQKELIVNDIQNCTPIPLSNASIERWIISEWILIFLVVWTSNPTPENTGDYRKHHFQSRW